MKNAIEWVKSLNVFDEGFYLSQFNNNELQSEDLINHYFSDGWLDGKNPTTWFDSDFYLSNNEDVKDAGVNPFFHYLRRGIIEGRSPGPKWLDIGFYQHKYADIIPKDVHPYTHYLSKGIALGLLPNSYIDENSILNKIYMKAGFNSVEQLQTFITDYAIRKTDKVDYSLYTSLYNDIKSMSEDEIDKHYLENGLKEGRFANIEDVIYSTGIDISILPTFNLEDFFKLNPLLVDLTLSQIYLKLIQYNKIDLIRFSYDDSKVASFYVQLAEHYLITKHPNKAREILLYANYIHPSARACELLGNMFVDQENYEKSKEYYLSALRYNGQSLWLFINTIKCLRKLNDFSQALSYLIKALNIFPLHSYLLDLLDEILQENWDHINVGYHVLAHSQQREILVEKVSKSVRYQADTLSLAFASYDSQDSLQTQTSLNTQKVHIIGDYHVSQCVRYRIDQKREQLIEAGYEVTTSSWTNINTNELNLSDIFIVYRAPALPPVIKAITKAKHLGKIVIYEIDDLIFDKIYPANYSEYAGAISIIEYGNLTHGMALFNAAIRLCDYAIASTIPLQQYLSQLVSTGQAFVHRNGLDFHNVSILENKISKSISTEALNISDETVTLFYGSGTLAHNTDFIEIALPAIEQMLSKFPHARFMVVGHLSLPKSFLTKFKQQVIQIPKTQTIDEYWQLLAEADINLAVLEINQINNCKSELKWFEAACFKTPSVVSATQNYIDVIRDGEDGLLAITAEDWLEALESLIKDETLRNTIGQKAYERVTKEYSVTALAQNIDNVIKKIVTHHGNAHD